MAATTELPPTWAELPELLTPLEVATVTRRSRNATYESIRSGSLRGVAVKIDGAWRISKSRLRALLEGPGDDAA
jgi:hypothetical protein